MHESSLGSALVAMREALGAKQEEIARRAGITPAMLSRYERGARWPHWTTLESVLDALGATLYDLARALDEAEGRAPQRTEAEADPRVVAVLTQRWTKNDADWILGYAAAVIDPEEPGSHERFAASVEVAASELGRFVLSQMAAPRPKSDDKPSN